MKKKVSVASAKTTKVNQEEPMNSYVSLNDWEAKSFPTLVQKREWKKLEKNPEALGVAIADDILREIRLEFSNSSKA